MSQKNKKKNLSTTRERFHPSGIPEQTAGNPVYGPDRFRQNTETTMKIAVVGATGLVGSKMLQLMEEYGLTDVELLPAASERSIGKEIRFAGKPYKVISVEDAIAARPDYAIFSAGASTSKKYAPLFAEKDGHPSSFGRSRSQHGCHQAPRPDYRQPQLQYHPNGLGTLSYP